MKRALASLFSFWTLAFVMATLAAAALTRTPKPRPLAQPPSRGAAFSRSSPRSSGARPASDERGLYAREGVERGRLATAPQKIPPRGLKDVLLRVWSNISEHRVLAIAAGVTFYALLAVFPAIAALVSIYSLFADPATIRSHLEGLSSILPGGAISVIGDQINRIAGQGHATLGLTTLFGLAVSLWSANAGMKAVFDALNVVYQEEEKRGFFKLNALSLGFTLAGIVLALAALAAIVALPPALSFVNLPSVTKNWVDILRWPLLLVFIVLAASVIYRYGPSRHEAKWRWLSWGAVLFVIVWLAASLLFSWYASHFGNFNKTYGSLGAAVGFMIWIWITNIVLLIGAELNAELEHQTAKDTTRGVEKPLGRRGALVADTVAPARG